jgi:protocatechuate 3,4-dioxygenase, alpha subunit
MYFPGEPKNHDDPVLNTVVPARRSTLIAVEDRGVLHFDIRLQGENETVFFAI